MPRVKRKSRTHKALQLVMQLVTKTKPRQSHRLAIGRARLAPPTLAARGKGGGPWVPPRPARGAAVAAATSYALMRACRRGGHWLLRSFEHHSFHSALRTCCATC